MKYIVFFASMVLLSMGCDREQTAVISGNIVVKGSAPHSYVAIEDKAHHTEYRIENARAFHLYKRQREKLTMEVMGVKKAMGPGFPAVVRVVKIY